MLPFLLIKFNSFERIFHIVSLVGFFLDWGGLGLIKFNSFELIFHIFSVSFTTNFALLPTEKS